MKRLRLDLRYVAGLLIVVGAVTSLCMMVWRQTVPFVYRRTYDCHYDGELDWLLGKHYDPTSVLHACETSVHRGAAIVGGLLVSIIVLSMVALLTRVTEYFARHVWSIDADTYGRLTKRFDRVRLWCGAGMLLATVWVVWWLWPLF